ncbi:MAG: membrane protein insertase YidC [Candidatus Binatia bacterium]|nr:MAG: membrane protein insertase YidC [Candidatus Binatia bacterium]
MMQHRALLAVALALLILVLYQEFVLKPYYGSPRGVSPTPSEGVRAPERAPAPPPPEPETAAEEAELPAAEAREIEIETELFRAVFTSAGGRLKRFDLKHYRLDPTPGSPPVPMVHPSGGEYPLGLELRGRGLERPLRDLGVAYAVRGEARRLRGGEEATLAFLWRAPDIEIEKRFRFRGDRYPFSLEIDVRKLPKDVTELGLQWVEAAERKVSGYYSFLGAVAVVDGKLVKLRMADLERKVQPYRGVVEWAGYADTYFLSALLPGSPESTDLWLFRRNGTAEARLVVPVRSGSLVSFRVFLGPKNFDVLESVHPTLRRAIDFGYFAFVAIPFLHILNFLHRFTGNYGVDIILLTVAIKLLFWPLTQKSFRSMKELQKLQPQMQKIREKFRDDPEKMQREIMELYRRHKVNPLSGCLPMLLQLPVFIGLYNTLLSAIELRHAPFALWIRDLSQPDRLGHFAIPFVSPPGIPVLTLLMGASMFVQQWISPPAGDPAQQKLMLFMPLVFTVIFINVPSGLVLYWLVNNVLTIAQQYFLLRSSK